MTVLSNLPGDVLLETFKHLLLPDPISLLMVRYTPRFKSNCTVNSFKDMYNTVSVF